MKYLYLLSISVLLFGSCSQSEKPLDKQAIIRAYKDSITLDSLRHSKKSLIAPVKKSSKITNDTRRYSSKDYNNMLAIIALYKDYKTSEKIGNLSDDARYRFEEMYNSAIVASKQINPKEVEFDNQQYEASYLLLDSIISSQKN